jgi:hypothetical protein
MCGRDDRAIQVRSPAEAKDISSSLRVRAGSEDNQPPVQWVRGGGGKRGPGVTLTTHPHLVPSASSSSSSSSLLKSTVRLYFRVSEVNNYDFLVVGTGITANPNIMSLFGHYCLVIKYVQTDVIGEVLVALDCR